MEITLFWVFLLLRKLTFVQTLYWLTDLHKLSYKNIFLIDWLIQYGDMSSATWQKQRQIYNYVNNNFGQSECQIIHVHIVQ